MTRRLRERATATRWALEWRGNERYFIWKYPMPLLFTTRLSALRYAREEYGYIATRKDLRSPPHNWRMPRPVRVEVKLKELRSGRV